MNEYREAATEIIDCVSGTDNIQSVQHCMTRLRITLKDRSLVDEEKLKNVDKVKGINDSAGQLQIILGTGVVNKVYKEISAVLDEEGKGQVEVKGGTFLQRISRLFGDIFIPIIPIIIASGVLMGVRAFLLESGMLTDGSAWFDILAVLIDTGFAFLPALVAWSATKKFGGSPVLGIVLGLMLLSPIFPAAGAVGRGTAEPLMLTVAGIEFAFTSYHGSILVAVVGGWILSFVEEKTSKVVPDVLDMIVTPIVTLAVTFFFIIFGIGPVFQFIEGLLVSAFQYLFSIPLGIGGFIIGGLQQVLVITGLHHALWIIDINFLEELGTNLYQPVRNASVLGQAGAVMAFAIFAKDKKLKSLSVAATVAALFGITEPAIFGATLIYGLPFVFGVIGSAVGGMFSTAIGLAAPGMGAAGIPGMLYFLGDGLGLYLIQSVITIAIPLVLTTWFIKKNKI